MPPKNNIDLIKKTQAADHRHVPAPDPRMTSYVSRVLVVMLILYIIPFLVVRTSFYRKWNPSFYARPLNFAYDTVGQNADVVIFGDSTALLGLDPSQVSASLGLKVINLPNTLSSLRVNDDDVLRRYLAANRPPRLIVFYFAPWDFDYGNLKLSPGMMYEGEEMLAERGSPHQIVGFVRTHPVETVAFPLTLFAAFWKAAEPRISYRYQDQVLAATAGHVVNVDASSLNPLCTIPPFAVEHIRFDWIHRVASQYKSPQTNIVYYVAPVPACTNVADVLRQPYDELPAAPPRVVPPSFFGNNSLFIHPRQSAVPAVTQQLVDALRPALTAARPIQGVTGTTELSK